MFQFDVPAASLSPGLYTCQINVIDDAAEVRKDVRDGQAVLSHLRKGMGVAQQLRHALDEGEPLAFEE